jgi:carbon starvation protein
LTKRLPATIIAIVCCVTLAFGAGGGTGAGGMVIWPLFGTTNQLLASLTLLVLSVFLLKLGRPVVYTLLPMTFLLIMSLLSLLVQLAAFWSRGEYFLVVMDVLILGAAMLVALEALAALRRAWGGPQPADAPGVPAVGP